MGVTRIGRLDAADPGFGGASRSRIQDIFRKGAARLSAQPQLWALGGLCVAVIVLDQLDPLAFAAPTLRAVIETGITLCALAGACLFGLSFGHRKGLRDLLLVAALVALATIDLASFVLPTALGLRSPGVLTSLPTFGTILAAGLLAAGAWAGPERKVRVGRLADRDRSPGSNRSALLTAAMIVFAGVGLSYLVSPAPGIGQVTAREGLRFVGLSMIFAAALRQEWGIRRAIAGAAAAEERRRIARDLHDGLAQDLAFIAAHGERIEGRNRRPFGIGRTIAEGSPAKRRRRARGSLRYTGFRRRRRVAVEPLRAGGRGSDRA
jgi:signal transduction histidine kinase